MATNQPYGVFSCTASDSLPEGWLAVDDNSEPLLTAGMVPSWVFLTLIQTKDSHDYNWKQEQQRATALSLIMSDGLTRLFAMDSPDRHRYAPADLRCTRRSDRR